MENLREKPEKRDSFGHWDAAEKINLKWTWLEW
jgi:hypothetical protein